ncbi:LAETG motif-containing sortase-dependent surface protein [Streptomyces sp. NPDC057293]|uniref:LAETG motif-containing sortase-dependent surface protein n=1 Tax=unclassified Streptomyces TaxID=2593676 RepID=UPI0036317B13
MNLLRKPAAVAVAALALAALPAAAQAHDGTHPFKNCTEAYDNGYSDIKEGDPHYGAHLDRDKDGVGCDKPPAGFEPADDSGDSGDSGEKATDENAGTGSGKDSGGDQATGQQGTDLAETGGDDSTPYIAAGGAIVVLAGGGLLLAVGKRRGNGAA